MVKPAADSPHPAPHRSGVLALSEIALTCKRAATVTLNNMSKYQQTPKCQITVNPVNALTELMKKTNCCFPEVSATPHKPDPAGY